MGSSNSDYRSPCSDETSPELYDAALFLENESEAKGTETETDDDLLNSSPRHAFSAGFVSHWTQPWSENTEICRNHQESQWSLPLDNGHSGEPAQKSVVANFSLLTWPSQNTKRAIIVRFSSYFSNYYIRLWWHCLRIVFIEFNPSGFLSERFYH